MKYEILSYCMLKEAWTARSKVLVVLGLDGSYVLIVPIIAVTRKLCLNRVSVL